jgi:hypothetical protein
LPIIWIVTAGSAATAFAARTFAAEKGVIQFDAPAQPFGRVTLHHHLRQLVLHLPGGGLRHAEAAAQLEAGEPCLLCVR